MPFEKNNKLGFTAKGSISLDKQPLSIRLKSGLKDKIKLIPEWQDRLRDVIENWIEIESNQK